MMIDGKILIIPLEEYNTMLSENLKLKSAFHKVCEELDKRGFSVETRSPFLEQTRLDVNQIKRHFLGE